MKRIIISIIATLMLLGITVKNDNSVIAEEVSGSERNVYKSVAFATSTGIGGHRTTDDYIVFNPDYFFEDNTVFNADIAKCSAGLSAAAYDYSYICKALDRLEFNYDYYKDSASDRRGNWGRSATINDCDFVKYIIANKTVAHNGEDYVLYLVVIQGTKGGYDWTSNFNLGDTDDHEGFYKASAEVMSDIYDQLSNDSFDKDHTIVWAMGHSRGGAVANIVSGELTDGYSNNRQFSNLISPDKVFGYTFGAMNVSKREAVKNSGHMNIYNILNDEDMLSMIPLSDWYYGRYGEEVKIDHYYKDVVTYRYRNELETKYHSDNNFATMMTEDVFPTLMANQDEYNGLIVQSFMNGLAYLLNDGKDWKTYLEYVGFHFQQNWWDMVVMYFNNTVPVLPDIISYAQKYAASQELAKQAGDETAGLTDKQFEKWLEDHKDLVAQLESTFGMNIATRDDLIRMAALAPLDLAFTFMQIPVSATDIEDLIIAFGDVYDYFTNIENDLNGLAVIEHTHSRTSYLFHVNAMYAGYRGFYQYKGKEVSAYNPEEEFVIKSVGNECFDGATAIKAVNLYDTIEYIDYEAFSDATGVKTMNIPDSLIFIGTRAFNNCNSWALNDPVIPEGVKTIREAAFHNCSSLTGTLVLPDADIGFMAFNYCTSLTGLEIPVDHITDGYHMDVYPSGHYFHPFSFCENIANIKVTGNGDMPEVHGFIEGDEYMFYVKGSGTPWGAVSYGHDRPVNVELSEGITSIGKYEFYRCTNLAEVKIPSTVTKIEYYAFYNCTNATGMTLPAGLTSINQFAFYNCQNWQLNDPEIPASVTSIGESAFQNCYKLTGKLTLHDTNIGFRAFNSCTGLTALEIPVNHITDSYHMDVYPSGHYFHPFSFCENIADIKVTGNGEMPDANFVLEGEDTRYYVKGSGTPWGAVSHGHTRPVNVELSEGVTSIGKYEFYRCTNLAEVSIPSTVTKIDYRAFYNCTNARGMTLPEGLTFLGDYAFQNCYGWDENNLQLPENLKIPMGAFINCIGLTGTIEISSTNTIGRMSFLNCTGLSGLVIPANKITEGIGRDNSSQPMYHPFSYCSGLKRIEVTCIGSMPIVYLDKSTNEMRGSKTPWGAAAARGATDLTVVIDEGISSLPSYCFNECTALEHLYLPYSLLLIQNNATSQCNNLQDVHYESCEFEWRDLIVYQGNTILEDDSKIFCKYDTEIEFITDESGMPTGAKATCSKNGVVNHVHDEEEIAENYFSIKEKVMVPADCTHPGVKIVTAKVNLNWQPYSKTYEVEIPEAHEYDPKYVETVKEPTCTEQGLEYIGEKCLKCGDFKIYSEVILDANGHNWSSAAFNWSDYDNVIAEWTCTVCNEKYANVGASYILEEVEATSEKDGYIIRTITLDGPDGIQDGGTNTQVIPRVGTNYSFVEFYWDEVENTAYARYHDSTYDQTSSVTADIYEVIDSRPVSCTENGYIEYSVGVSSSVALDGNSQKGTVRYVLKATGHNSGEPVIENNIAATCTEDGGYDEVVFCEICGSEISREHITNPAFGHSWTNWEINRVASCAVEGEKTRTCRICEATETQVIEKTAHNPGTADIENYKERTCTEAGSWDYVVRCTECNEIISSEHEEFDAFGHSYGEWVTITETSCTEQGVQSAVCSRCGEEEFRYLPVLGHDYDDWTVMKEPTCTESGLEETVCSRCHDTQTNIIPALGHEADTPVTLNETYPTCTKDGGYDVVTTCWRCGELMESEHFVIPATGHQWDEWYVAYNATCLEPGYEERVCTKCLTTEQRELPMLDHTPIDPMKENIIEPNCTEEGGYDMVTYCSSCNQVLSREHFVTEALGHDISEGEVIKEATCTQTGVIRGICSRCGLVETTEIPLKDHTPSTPVKKNEKAPTCTEAGGYDLITTCTVCGAQIKSEHVSTDPLGHNWSEWSFDGENAKTHTRVCLNDPSHKETHDCEFDEGKTVGNVTGYTCKICGGIYTETSDTPVTPTPEIDGEIRVAGANRFGTSKAIASTIRNNMGVEKLDTVILASGTNFADALAGSYLAAVKNAPIIITRNDKVSEINAYIKENVKKGGTIYVLGGTAAVPESCLAGLSSYKIERLAGNNRYLTNLEILIAAGMDSDALLVATGNNFADSLSASASGLPMLLVRDDGLTDQQKQFLNQVKGKKIYILGGTGAVKPLIENQLKNYGKVERIAGSTRFETSYLIAEKFYPNAEYAVLAYSNDYPDGLCGGPLAYQIQAPLILTRSGNEDLAARYVKDRNIEDGYILGGVNALPDSVAQKIFGHKIKEVIDK